MEPLPFVAASVWDPSLDCKERLEWLLHDKPLDQRINAGCIYWRSDQTARRCAADWRDDCLEWCDERVCADGRFMNQSYLTRWPERYTGVHIIRHPGVNLGPWNVDGHLLRRDGGSLRVDGRPLIFYHFSGIVRDREGRWYS